MFKKLHKVSIIWKMDFSITKVSFIFLSTNMNQKIYHEKKFASNLKWFQHQEKFLLIDLWSQKLFKVAVNDSSSC